MIQRSFPLAIVVLSAAGVAWSAHYFMTHRKSDALAAVDPANSTAPLLSEPDKEIGSPLYAAVISNTEAPDIAMSPIPNPVLGDCRLAAFEKEDVPSARDGVIWIIGTEVGEDEKVPDELLIRPADSRGGKRYRRLREGDVVKNGQLLAQLDDRLARAELLIKEAKIVAAEADAAASEKAKDASRASYDTGLKLLAQRNAISEEELRERKLNWDKYTFEHKNKLAAVKVALAERNQALTVVGMHEIRSSIDGIVKTIFKNPGEAVKGSPSSEPVFEILNLKQLRVEGLMHEQYLPFLRPGDDVDVEVIGSQAPEQVLVGHLQDVTSVAVTRDSKCLASSSMDGTVRVWERTARRERRILPHPGPVLAIACGSDHRCLSGSADGSARLWDLDGDARKPLVTIAAAHRGAINSVAISPDGRTLATGGEDRDINLWDAETGALKYALLGHSGAITSVQFTPLTQLISAGRDNTIRIWSLGTEGGRLENTLTRRSGDVIQPGVSPDGKRILFDAWQSKALRLLTLPDGLTEAVLDEPSGSARFTTFSLFSPDGKTVLTASGAESRLHLWQLPTPASRPHVLHSLATPRQANCAAFAPDGSYIAVGNRDRQILIFARPNAKEPAAPRRARVTHIEKALDSHQVRVWAVLDNPDGRLMPGATVTMVRYPREAGR